MNQKELFIISITIFLTIVAWMLIEAYKVETAIQSEKEEIAVIGKKINIDLEVIKILKGKQSL